jgi:GR25 family glycosyltransferase involved in LPS biosynthesis
LNKIIYDQKENKLILKQSIDELLKNYLENNKLNDNIFIDYIEFLNISPLDKDFYFGITIPNFNRNIITKIFLYCLEENINYDSVVFCLVDDGSDYDIMKLIKEHLNFKLKFIVIKMKKNKNRNNNNNNKTIIEGSFFPLNIYIGNELLKGKCKYLGILDSDTIINENYFKNTEKLIRSLDMQNNIISGFNSDNKYHKILKNEIVKDIEVVYKEKIGGISLFYDKNLYENFKYCFIDETDSFNFDLQISKYMIKNKKNILCFKKSTIQHIGIHSSIIRNNIKINKDDNFYIDNIYKLLKNNYNDKFIGFDYGINFNIKYIPLLFYNNINEYLIDNNLIDSEYIFKLYNLNIKLKDTLPYLKNENIIFSNLFHIYCKFNNNICYYDNLINYIKLSKKIKSNFYSNFDFTLFSKDYDIELNKFSCIVYSFINDINLSGYKFDENKNKNKNFNLNTELYFVKKFNEIIFITNKYGEMISINMINILKQIYPDINIKIYKIKLGEIIDYDENILYFIMFAHSVQNFPKNYIIIQLEQIIQSFWFDERLKNILNESLINLDYSIMNLNLYKNFIINTDNYYFNLSLENNNNIINKKFEYDYDILFFGSIYNCRRRNKILDKLKDENLNLKIITKTFGDELKPYIKKSKIVINIHYYENAILEIPRIYEIIDNNTIIISEESFDKNYLLDLPIHFIPIINNDISILLKKIKKILKQFDWYQDDTITKYNKFKNNNNKISIENMKNIIEKANLKFKIDNKIALISCNYGNFDINEIDIEKIKKYNSIDWYLFTDDIKSAISKKWNYITKKDDIMKDIKHLDNKILSKYIKFKILKKNIFEKYDYIIWIDSSFIIQNNNFVKDVNKLINKNVEKELFIFEHYQRSSILSEFVFANPLEKYKDCNHISFMKKITQDNSYIDNKLFESGFLICKNNKKIKKFYNTIYQDIINFGKCCQIFIPYEIYNHNIDYYLLTEENFKKNKMDGSIWTNKLIGKVKTSHSDDNGYKSMIPYHNINFIDEIIYINLEKSVDRNWYMKEILKKVNVPSKRFNAINGYEIDAKKLIKNFDFERNMNNCELACCLSHLKIILSLDTKKGNYFMICEDDISFNNIIYFKKDLKNIIQNAPDFDILILYKTYLTELNKEYVKFSDYFNLEPIHHIGGAVAYIISRNGIKKFNKNFEIKNDIIINKNKYIKMDVSDIFLYRHYNTYVYKYNYININLEFESTLHNHSNIQNKNYNFQFKQIINKFENVKYYSIGCDCHPANLLKSLKLRHAAGPFDWMNVTSEYCPEYFLKIVKSSFKNFLDKLTINKNNIVISENYPNFEFFHDNDLITNTETMCKYKRRIKRFMNDYKNSKCVFLLNIKYDDIHNEKIVLKLVTDINNILDDDYFKKNNHILYIYLRYDENFDENKILCELFISKLLKIKNIKNIKFKKYCRYKNKFGIWGNSSDYYKIFSDLFNF